MLAEITMQDGRIEYQTVMFPANPFWGETILSDPRVAYVKQVPDDAPRYRWEHERLYQVRGK